MKVPENPKGDDRKSPRKPEATASPPATDDTASRQDELLDEALKETFPASDPVSVAHVK